MSKELSISLFSLVARRIHGIRTVSSGAVNRTIPQSEFPETCQRYQREAADQRRSMSKVADGLWKTEGVSTTFGKYRLPDNTLNDPHIPRESLGIAHVGYGAASNEYARFDVTKLNEIFEEKCEPNYRMFSYEGIGAALRIYEPGFFKFMCGVLGLIPRGAPPGPDKTGFFASFFSAFSPEMQRVATHGYGRLVAFSRISVYKAIQEALGFPGERVQPCVQGIGFAFAMMNAVEMSRLLENSGTLSPAPIRAAFQNGLVYAMIFCDWFAPGFAVEWQPRGKLEEKLVELCRSESALNLKRGYPLAFMLENPINA